MLTRICVSVWRYSLYSMKLILGFVKLSLDFSCTINTWMDLSKIDWFAQTEMFIMYIHICVAWWRFKCLLHIAHMCVCTGISVGYTVYRYMSVSMYICLCTKTNQYLTNIVRSIGALRIQWNGFGLIPLELSNKNGCFADIFINVHSRSMCTHKCARLQIFTMRTITKTTTPTSTPTFYIYKTLKFTEEKIRRT